MKVQSYVCRDVTLKAYVLWAEWAAKGLCMELQAALQSDAALKSSVPLQAWEETIIAQVNALPCPYHPPSVCLSTCCFGASAVQLLLL